MVLTRPPSDTDVSVHSTFASRYVRASLPRYRMPENSIPKEAAYQIINDELMLDGNPRLNLASFVTTWMEPECDKLIMGSINKNYVDMDEYPITTELQNRCVNMIAHLFHAPLGESETAVGVGTVGSSEAIMLAGLAFKRKWQNKRKAEGKPFDKPNIITGANVQVCWEKFARYFEVELKEVKLREGYYVMDPEQAVEMVDENTICVAAILGSTLNGEFEDVKLINDLLDKKNKETGWVTNKQNVATQNCTAPRYPSYFRDDEPIAFRAKQQRSPRFRGGETAAFQRKTAKINRTLAGRARQEKKHEENDR